MEALPIRITPLGGNAIDPITPTFIPAFELEFSQFHQQPVRYVIFILLFLIFSPVGAQQDYRHFYSEAEKAYKENNFTLFHQQISKAHDLHPYHQVILYKAGIAAALNNLPDEAISFLEKALLIDASFDLGNKDLLSLKDRDDFHALVTLQKDLLQSIANSDTAVVIHDRQLHAEGIAYDPQTNCFYLGSIRKKKIVRINSRGAVSDLKGTRDSRMTSVFGLKVDTRHNALWVCSSPIEEMEQYDASLPSLVFRFDLANDTLLQPYAAPTDVKGSIFGDLQISPGGDVFVSDSKNNVIFKVNEKKVALEKFFESPQFWNIQGITFSHDGTIMFIADYIKGLYRLDMKTMALTKIECNLAVSLKGIDGLNFHKGSLLAIQNGVRPMRVTRYFLNAGLTRITSFEILDRGLPVMNEPTLGTIVDDKFYYIANSQWSGYNEQHEIKPADQLQDIVIMTSDLGKKKEQK